MYLPSTPSIRGKDGEEYGVLVRAGAEDFRVTTLHRLHIRHFDKLDDSGESFLPAFAVK